MPEADNLIRDIDAPLATITLNRPTQLNPLDWQTIRQLRATFAELEAEPTVRAVIITGAGRAFSAGGDLKGYQKLYRAPDDFRGFLQDFYLLLDAIERSEMIVLAAINGACVAGGLELMMACDLALAAEDAKIGDGHLNFAQLPGAGASQRLPRLIGTQRAKMLMFTGELISGTEAAAIGLVNKAVAADRLMEEAVALARTIMEMSPTALRGAKYLINEGMRTDLQAGLALEIAYVHNYATAIPDALEGLAAFAEKREPRYKGVNGNE